MTTPAPPTARPHRTSAQILDRLLHPREQTEIVQAVRSAELRTSCELKVHVESRCPATDPYTRAVQLFEKLGLQRTAHRNGVLLYVAVHDRRFSIIGDTGIGEPATAELWAGAMRQMSIAFRRGAFGEGIVAALRELTPKLAKRFPGQPGNADEIDNDLSTEDTAA